jgi:3-hydroxyacyl-[acyl-carrier-protein] dehydratase
VTHLNGKPESGSMDILELMEVLPHRYPFLFLDRVTEYVPNSFARGYKNLTMNEPFFQGHFPGYPLMPGVVQIEALAQLGGIIILSPDDFRRRSALLTGVEKARFRRPVIPGDRFDMEARVLRMRSNMGWVKATGMVDGKVTVTAELMFSVSAVSGAQFRHDAKVLGL